MARHCQDRGIYVQAIPHPVVPKGTARLRAAVTALHRTADLDYCVAVIREAADRYPTDRDGIQDTGFARCLLVRQWPTEECTQSASSRKFDPFSRSLRIMR
jgi:hypothetical protein